MIIAVLFFVGRFLFFFLGHNHTESIESCNTKFWSEFGGPHKRTHFKTVGIKGMGIQGTKFTRKSVS